MAYLMPGRRAQAAGLLDGIHHPAQVAWRITPEAVAVRAHELWQQDHDRAARDNWKQAESELFAAAGLTGRSLPGRAPTQPGAPLAR